MSQNAYLSEPDPDFIAALDGKSLPATFPEDVLVRNEPFDFPACRAELAALFDAVNVNAPDQVSPDLITRKDILITAGDGFGIKAEVYIPSLNIGLGEQSGHRFPVFCWFHGGGWVIGEPKMNRVDFEKVAIKCRVVVFNIGYRLAPEYPFPTGVTDAYTGLKWAAKHAADFQADLNKGFVIGGQSAGGNLAAALCHMARDDASFKHTVTGQLLQIPALIHLDGIPEKFKEELYSNIQNADTDMVLGRGAVRFMINCYDVKDPSDTRASPLLLSSFERLPPAYIQVCGGDLLRDHGFLYQKLLREAGVTANLDAYPGVPHGWFVYLPQMKSSIKFWEDTYRGLNWLLNGAK